MRAPLPVPPGVDRAFAMLLRAYPAAFRAEYAGEMRAAFRCRWRGERAQRGVRGTIALWLSLLVDIARTAPPAHAEILGRDVRYAVRSLTDRRHASFTAAAVVTLAVGIAAVTTIFTIVYAVLLAPIPYREPDRVVRVWEQNAPLGITKYPLSGPNYLSLEERARSFSSVAALLGEHVNLTGEGNPERVQGVAASSNFWDTIGVPPVAGRTFVTSDDLAVSPDVVMISESFWARRYGRSESAIGSTIEVNLSPRRIVGIAPQDAGFASDVDIWMPLGRDPTLFANRGNHRLVILGRLAPGVSIAQADDELQRIGSDLAREFPISNGNWRLSVAPLRAWLVDGDLDARLRIVFAAVGLLLLVAATNVANLQLARATGRGREIAVRLALGASQARIVRQMVTESLVLSAVGGITGLALAVAGVRVAVGLLPASTPRLESIGINVPVLLVAAACILATTLLSGLVPAMIAVRAGVRGALQDASRSTTGARTPARHALVAIQIALATTLVVSAALLGQSLARLQGVPLGFSDPDRLLTARITRSIAAEEAHETNVAFYRAAIDSVAAIPGVVSVGMSSEVPFGEGNTTMAVGPIPRPASVPEQGIQASWRVVTASYLRTMNVPVRQGRLFDEWLDPPRSIMVSESLARRLWPDGRDPIGTRVWMSNGQVFTILGVVGDVRQTDLAADPNPTMYLSPEWYLWPTMALVVRTEGDPGSYTQSIRDAVARIDPRQPVADFRTMQAAVALHAAEPRLNSVLVGSFAALALLLASIGVAGVVSYTVAQRTPEIAIRLALGSSPGGAVRLLMRAGLGLCVAGIGAGLLLALALGRAFANVLFGVRPNDPATLAAAAIGLLFVAVIACWLPARRASRVSPALALRNG